MPADPIVNRIRIIPRQSDFLNRNIGSSGEVFYDKDSNALRLYDGRLAGGYEIARSDLTNITSTNFIKIADEAGIFGPNIHIHNVTVSGDIDYVTFTVGTAPITALYLTKYVGVDEIAWFGIVQGATWTAGIDPDLMLVQNHFGPSVPSYGVGDNVLADKGITLAASTTYTMRIQQTGSNQTEYIFSTNLNYTATTPPADYSDDENNPTVIYQSAGSGGGAVDSGTSIDISDTAPDSPEAGNLWFNASTGRLYVYVEDVDSSQWVQPSAPTYPSFKTFQIQGDGGSPLVATAVADTMTLVEGAGINLSIDAATKTLTITNTGSAPDFGNFTFSGSDLATDDSSSINLVPSVIANSDLVVENDLTVNNKLYAKEFINNGVGITSIASASTLTLEAQDVVRVIGAPFRLPSFTDAEKAGIIASNGDMIYNTTNNRPEMYVNGAWKIVDTSAIV